MKRRDGTILLEECIVSKIEKEDIKESDLFLPVCEYLESLGYSVNGEVKDCDLLANKEEEWLVVELKKTLNLEVILQAAERQKISDLVYIAVLKPKKFTKNSKFKRICHLLRRLEIGLMLVKFSGEQGQVEVVQTAEPFDRIKSQRANQNRKLKTQEEFKKRKGKSIGGVSRTKVMTAYREQAILIAQTLEKIGPSKPKNLIETNLDLKRIQTILYDNYYGWFERVNTGIYQTNHNWETFKKESEEK